MLFVPSTCCTTVDSSWLQRYNDFKLFPSFLKHPVLQQKDSVPEQASPAVQMPPPMKPVATAPLTKPGTWFFQIWRWAIQVDLGPARAAAVTARGRRGSWERTACCRGAAAALLTALTQLRSSASRALGTSPAVSALGVSPLCLPTKPSF